ncbi:DEAD/DEAH box helicase [Heyndrickxia sporothermodurans]|uniref:DEAD/DEAH box helicase n=1 Tax=Heyndrickxia sporothermodurans TaxID=46224 RepID=UPI002E1DBAD6|nr:DEAD/DEAH box helicase [Heyndrickxia sporothermodurans]MED3780728.1 DEAD/DEAH box helicase [Heyndrickxia sporothermodurans]
MDIKLSLKTIKERCGTVSYKKGEAFFRANKVNFDVLQSNRCEATVSGTEKFYVLIEVDADGTLHSTCSCPTLASFKQDCQHIAAVLLAIYENQHSGRKEILSSLDNNLSSGVLNLFSTQPKRSSAHQLHFENRQIVPLEFICHPIKMDDKNFFGMKIKIDTFYVEKIRDFLLIIKNGRTGLISPTFTYDPALYCFKNDADDVLQHLIRVILDEKIYNDQVYSIKDNTILIPPSSWERLYPLLINTPLIKLEYRGQTYDQLAVANEKLPLQFELTEREGSGFLLKVIGLNNLIIFNEYNFALVDGKLYLLKSEESKRISDLKQMLEDSRTNQITFSENQFHLFLEKVMPSLKKLGDIRINGNLVEQLKRTPLKAKLYLDRIRNRLLAGLEFHYEHMVINPLENRSQLAGTTIIRDEEKEEEILQLMEASSFTKTDEGYFLHNEELEYEFLYHTLPKLQKLVQVYATTAVRNRISKKSTPMKIRVRLKNERTNWLEFSFEMDGIPERQIRDILQALEEKRKYYRLRDGSLLSLETREMKEIHRFLHALPVQNEDWEKSLDIPLVKAIPYLDGVEDRSMFMVEESFRTFLDTIKQPERMKVEVPDMLKGVLRDYQKVGYKWMKTLASFGFGGILADDMGLGKTVQSIAFILSVLPEVRKNKTPILIICPSSVTYNWLSECMKFAPEIQAVVVDGNKTERSAILKDLKNLDVLITSYPLIRRDVKWFEKQFFHTVFFDEAQAFKNPVTQTARAVKKIQADHRFALTGTPVENSLEELWSIFHIVFPELFRGLKEYSNLTRKTISRRIRPFLLRRLKSDVLSELPEKIESTDSIELLPEQKKLYAAYLAKLRHDTLKHLDKDTLRKNKIRILAGLTRLRQICCHPALFVDGYKGSSAKFLQLMQIIEEAKESGRRVLIFSQFTKMLELIGKELVIQGLPFFYLDGQTPSDERIEICNRFNHGERDLFLISLKAGGTGLNLTGADTVILYDTWWNPAVEAQAADRAYRIGQQNTVQVVKLVARGTIEEKMNELQERKKNLIGEIIDEKAATSLTEEDIREILLV